MIKELSQKVESIEKELNQCLFEMEPPKFLVQSWHDAIDSLQEKQMELFLDYFNNFLTVQRFAEYYGLTNCEAVEVIEQGRKSHESRVLRSRLTPVDRFAK